MRIIAQTPYVQRNYSAKPQNKPAFGCDFCNLTESYLKPFGAKKGAVQAYVNEKQQILKELNRHAGIEVPDDKIHYDVLCTLSKGLSNRSKTKDAFVKEINRCLEHPLSKEEIVNAGQQLFEECRSTLIAMGLSSGTNTNILA